MRLLGFVETFWTKIELLTQCEISFFFPFEESRQISGIVNSVADKHQSRNDRTTTIEALFHDFKKIGNGP